MKKKGFTLIEVLAVVSILGIIGIIIYPKIMNTINNSKKNNLELSVNGLIDALNDYVFDKKANLIPFDGCSMDFLNNINTCEGLEYSGSLPENGNLVIDADGIVNGYVMYNSDDFFGVTNNAISDEIYIKPGTEYVFSYTGDEQLFKVLKDGIYRIELWGAQGGKGYLSNRNSPEAGMGAYTSGEIYLNKKQNLYIYVGGQGTSASGVSLLNEGGYNGGGDGCISSDGDDSSGGGGGATDVRLVSKNDISRRSLASRIMVAAGGGGAHVTNTTLYTDGMAGGALAVTGMLSAWNYTWTPVVTQTVGSAFGVGAPGVTVGAAGAGGGGGYYGGVNKISSNISGSASGGTSYISGYKGCVAVLSENNINPRNDSEDNLCVDGTTDRVCSIHYSNFVFDNPIMKSGLQGMPNYDLTEFTIGHSGNGYAKITYVGERDSEDLKYKYYYTGDIQTFTAPSDGYYKLEVWGAQGGSSSSQQGGYGGYSVGTLKLRKDTLLYIVVGGQGGVEALSGGGYNGGGNSGASVSSAGGGATSIAYRSGLLSSLEEYKGILSSNGEYYVSNDIIIVAGGGGGYGCETTDGCTIGGSGGGYVGGVNAQIYGGCKSSNAMCYGSGGTQTLGGKAGSYATNNSGFAGGFGLGGNGKNFQVSSGNGGGGGGGFFGGGGAAYNSGGGGSSYIAHPKLIDKSMYCYKCNESQNINTKTTSIKNVSEYPISKYAKAGDGYAEITYIGKNI